MRNNAGFEIIMATQFPNEIEVVLGMSATQWVTWLCSKGDSYYWGHYFINEIDAKIDFFERVQREAQYYIDLYESRRSPWLRETEKE